MHRNYFTFSADTHFQLGLALGRQFRHAAEVGLAEARAEKLWPQKVATAHKQLALTQNYFPDYLEELNGYSQAAGVPFDEFWALAIEDDAFAIKNQNQGRCTNVVTNNGLLVGHNEDYIPHQKNSVCVIKKTIQGLTTLEIFYYNTVGGTSIGVSSHGYVHTINTLFYTPKKIGVPKAMISRYLLDSSNPEEAIEFVKQLPRTSGYNHNIVNREGSILNVEFTAATCRKQYPNPPFAHTNHCLIGRTGVSKRNCWGTQTRLQSVNSMAKPHMTSAEMCQLLSNQQHGTIESVWNERTVGKMVVDLEKLTSLIWLRDEAEQGWVEYPLNFTT